MIYCSFADDNGWLGAVYAPGFNLTHNPAAPSEDRVTVMILTSELHEHGCNPGGEILFFQVPGEVEELVPEADHWQLLDLQGVNRIDKLCGGEGVSSLRTEVPDA